LIKTALAHVHDLSEIAVITFLKAALAAREEEEKGRGSTSSAVEEAPEGSASAAVRVVIKLCLEAPHCPEFMHDAVAAMLNSGEVMSLLLYLTDCCLEPPRYLGKQGATDGAAAAEQSEGGGAAGKKAKKAKKAADLSAIESQVSAAPLAAPSHLPRMQIVSWYCFRLLAVLDTDQSCPSAPFPTTGPGLARHPSRRPLPPSGDAEELPRPSHAAG
jgi:hypothetical protein